MTADEIIEYMQSRSGKLNVAFTRDDWHGQPVTSPVFVSRFGTLDERYELVRDVGREALGLWRRFSQEPQRFYDLEARAIVWR
ncbi:MAG: hypothetical protein WD492_13010 [Alkalispirochaeta sp.]